jgi:hypothetical protein
VAELGRVDDADGVEALYGDVVRAAESIAEPRPDLALVGLAGMAARVGRPLSALVAEYQQQADYCRVDLVAAARTAGRASPVRYAPVFVWRQVQYAVGDRPRPRRTGRPRRGVRKPYEWHPADLADYQARPVLVLSADDVADQVEVVEGPPAPAPYVPEPEPVRRVTVEEFRAIRERVEAERQRQAPACTAAASGPAPPGRLAALLERTRAERRAGRTLDSGTPVPSPSPEMGEERGRA